MARIWEECEVCGGDVAIETEAEQSGETWTVYDGDNGECSECGARLTAVVYGPLMVDFLSGEPREGWSLDAEETP